MVVVTVLKFALVAGTIYLTKELGVWDDPHNPRTQRDMLGKTKNTLFDDDDKKDLQRKMNEYRKKYCEKGSICEPPPPKSWTESIDEAWERTLKKLKKIPAYWEQAFDDIVIKVALAAGTIYATKQLGVWDSPEVTSVIYDDAKSHIKPYGLQLKEKYCCRECETCQREPPKPWRESLVDAWNDTIKKTFDILVQVPTYCRRFTEDVQETINIFINKK